jgi:hypothetical protein
MSGDLPSSPEAPPSGLTDPAPRFALALGWCLLIAALSRLAFTARNLENPPMWIRQWFAPFLLPLVVLVACARDLRMALIASVPASLALGAFAVADLRGHRSGLGRFEIALAISGLLLTGAVALWPRPAPAEPAEPH